jgi:1-acyl-sn-glycerol-3-phosphate acyltransferase
MLPNLGEAASVLQQVAATRPKNLVLLSSALIYGTGPGRQSLVSEEYAAVGSGKHRVSSAWKAVEALAKQELGSVVPLTILRPVTVLPSPALASRRLQRKLSLTLPGHNPTLQLLSLGDLAEAVRCAVNGKRSGVFNVAPDGVIPQDKARRAAGIYGIPLPHTLQRLARSAETLDYLRYPATVSNQKIKDQLGFRPSSSSLGTIRDSRKRSLESAVPEPVFDVFGMDRSYIDSYSRTLFKFLCDFYWRIETRGLQHVPSVGPAILTGTHRGFMPLDGVMALQLVLQKTRRVPRFLTHPALFKFPFISDFVTRLGGVVACQESADRILRSGELLGIYPEGVQGAFARYREAYRLRSFGRHDFVKIALRHRVPIVPFVTVGSAEIFPVFAQIRWRRWMRYSDWPCLPLSTFPFLPLPLPTKWHVRFLPPVHVDQYPPEAAHDSSAVKGISRIVQAQMQQAMDEIVSRRPSWFWGSVFEAEEDN